MISAAEVDACINEVRPQEAHRFASKFLAQSTAQREDTPWRLLEHLFSVYFRFSDIRNPFEDRLNDICDNELEWLRSIMNESNDPEIRARLGDVLWIKAKDYKAAQVAVAAYLASGLRLEHPANWAHAGHQYERATRLALSLGKKSQLINTVTDHLLQRLRFYKGEDPLYLSEHLLKLLELLKAGDPIELVEYARAAAEKARSFGDGNRARTYFQRTSRLYHLTGNRTAERAALIAAAATWVDDADRREREGNFLAAYIFLESAIRDHRAIGEMQAIPNLQRRLNEAGSRARQNMQEISFELDLTEQAQTARELMSGLSVENAVCTFASLVPLIEPGNFRKEVLANADQHPLQYCVTRIHFDGGGRKIAGTASLLSQNSEERERGIREEIASSAAQHYSITAAALILPAHAVILDEHPNAENIISEFCCASEIIPPDRAEYFSKGLALGFRGDFIASLHILVPQIEHLLRYLLKQCGVITTALDSDGIEEEWPLGRILSSPEIPNILPERLIFVLRSILTEKTGANIRNLFLHGLLPPGDCSSTSCIFFMVARALYNRAADSAV
jgi:hypothetical protein